MLPTPALRAAVLAAFFLVLAVDTAQADVGVTIASPKAGAVSGNVLSLSVNVRSLYEMASVRAVVGKVSSDLQETQLGVFAGALTLTGVAKGSRR